MLLYNYDYKNLKHALINGLLKLTPKTPQLT